MAFEILRQENLPNDGMLQSFPTIRVYTRTDLLQPAGSETEAKPKLSFASSKMYAGAYLGLGA